MERRNFIVGLPLMASALDAAAKTKKQPVSSFQTQMELMQVLVRPVMDAWAEGRLVAAMDRMEFPRKDRLRFAALEVVARTFYPMCFAMPDGRFLSDEVLRAFQQSISPGKPDSFNWDKGEQPLVDAAILAAGFLHNPGLFEQKLNASIQAGLIDGWRKSLSIKPYNNNWLLFAAMVETALEKWDKPFKPEAIPFAFHRFEEWYLGDGLYGDGPRFHMDYYNSIIIHPYLLLLGEYNKEIPDAGKRMKRALRYAEILVRQVSEEGFFPTTGRSICYRSGLFHHLAFMAARNYFPKEQNLIPVKNALDRVIGKSLHVSGSGKPGSGTVDEATGILRPGLFGFQPQLAESYIGTASLYLATWAFLPLGLGQDHMWWKQAIGPEPQIRIDEALKD